MPTGLVYDDRCLGHDNGSMLVDERAQQWLDVPHPVWPSTSNGSNLARRPRTT